MSKNNAEKCRKQRQQWAAAGLKTRGSIRCNDGTWNQFLKIEGATIPEKFENLVEFYINNRGLENDWK